MRHNRRMPEYSSIAALDALLANMRVGEARRRQLSMVRGELLRALERDALPVGARRSLQRLLGVETLTIYVRLAESGALRARRVAAGQSATSAATNEIRLQCLDALRAAYRLPVLQLGGATVDLQSTPEFGTLAALRRQLDQHLGDSMSPGLTRLTAVLALILDAAPRSGELVSLRLSDLAHGHRAVYVERRPQRGSSRSDADWFELSALSRAALDRWLALREQLILRAHGTSRLWVSLRPNHSGTLDPQGQPVLRPAGMPLEEKGLTDSYRSGRARHGLARLLPSKMEQLRRAVLNQSPPVALDVAPGALL
jgi:integrase